MCSVCAQHLRANLPSYEVGLYEQNALTFLMYTQPELLDNCVFDISSYGLNCWCAPCCPSHPPSTQKMGEKQRAPF